MNELDCLSLEAEKLIQEFSQLDTVKKYHAIQKALQEDTHLQHLKQQREEIQKGIRYLPSDKQQEALKACQELKAEYDNDPLVVNYQVLKEEVLKLIEPLTETKL